MIIWFGLACFAAGLFIGWWYERAGLPVLSRHSISDEELDTILREDLRRELMDGFNDQEDPDLAG